MTDTNITPGGEAPTDENEQSPILDEMGNFIDPLVWTGVSLVLLSKLPTEMSLTLAAGSLVVSVIWMWGLIRQPVRTATDWLSSEVADRAN